MLILFLLFMILFLINRFFIANVDACEIKIEIIKLMSNKALNEKYHEKWKDFPELYKKYTWDQNKILFHLMFFLKDKNLNNFFYDKDLYRELIS